MGKMLPLAAALLALTAAVPAGGGGARAPKGETIIDLQVLRQGKYVMAVVPVTINGHRFAFALDTGAAGSLLDSQAARVFHVPKAGSAGKIGSITGVAKAGKVKVKQWSVGGIKLPPTTLVTTNLPFGNARAGIQGLLGSDMLSRYDVITIDYTRGLLKLHAKPPR